MRLQNAGTHEGADEIFMNFAPGGQTDHNGNNDHQDTISEPNQHSYEDPLDDVFGSAPPSPLLEPRHETSNDFPESPHSRRTQIQDPSDIPRLRSLHVTNGYREGLSASKEQHVQAGFDEGYSLGAELGMKVGWILGVLEGVVRALPVPATATHAVSATGASEGGGEAEGEESRESRVLTREVLRAELKQAEEETSMQRLFGEEFFGGDGVWTYSVPEGEGGSEESVTFKEVAEAHPLVVKWEGRVRELAESLNLRME